MRTIGTHDTVDTHTLFALGSTTKAFTAMAVALMVDAGRLRCDGPVASYVPGFVLRDPYVTHELRLRDLLTHELGFADPEYVWYGSDQPPSTSATARCCQGYQPPNSRRMSLENANPISSTISTMPTAVSRSRSLSGSGRRITASASRNRN